VPIWLRNQLSRAFYHKDRRRIRLLNECWFFYHARLSGAADGNAVKRRRNRRD